MIAHTKSKNSRVPAENIPRNPPHPPQNRITKTYRLSPPDERDVRWGLSQDVKGDVGIRSTFAAFEQAMNLRALMRPWTESDPPRRGHPNGYHVDLRNHQSQAMECKGEDRRTLLTYEMSEELLEAAADIRLVWGAFALIGPQRLAVLARVYRDRCPGGLDAFDDVAALAVDTRGAQRCYARDIHADNPNRGLVGSLMSLSHRIRSPESLADDNLRETDRTLWAEIYEEADAALSGACRAYTKAAARMRQARRVEQVGTITRRNCA